MPTAESDRHSAHRYSPPSQDGRLHFAWNGHEEYVRVYAADAEYAHAVINTTDTTVEDRWQCLIPEGDQAAFERFCDEWITEADPAELALP